MSSSSATSQKRLRKVIDHLSNKSNLKQLTAFEQCVGNTPLLYLSSASKIAGCSIFGKAEFLNPGGSVKDRAALWMILEAEHQGILVRGEPGIIIEGTGGNTGIGLAIAGKMFGYHVLIVINSAQSQEKKDMLKQCGAVLIEVPAEPYTSPNHFQRFAARFAANLSAHYANHSHSHNHNHNNTKTKMKTQKQMRMRVLYADQWSNMANRRAHIEGTGPEIWRQTNGQVSVFSCASGTGGSIAGVGLYLKSMNPSIRICLTDPMHTDMVPFFQTGSLPVNKTVSKDSIVEGVGLTGRVSGQLSSLNGGSNSDGDNTVIIAPENCFEIDDTAMMEAVQMLQRSDGLMVGMSSGMNVAGAMRVAKHFNLSADDIVVTLLCDRSDRYVSKQFNIPFLKEKGLPAPEWYQVSAAMVDQQLPAIIQATFQ